MADAVVRTGAAVLVEQGTIVAVDDERTLRDANPAANIVDCEQGVLTPGFAVIWAAFFNFIAVFILGVAVAKTVGKGIIVTEAVSNHVLFAALVGAVLWNLLTWWLGLPTSSSHALIGGLVGGAVAGHGFGAVILPGLIKVAVFIVIARQCASVNVPA